jgi:hypothetical protein
MHSFPDDALSNHLVARVALLQGAQVDIAIMFSLPHPRKVRRHWRRYDSSDNSHWSLARDAYNRVFARGGRVIWKTREGGEGSLFKEGRLCLRLPGQQVLLVHDRGEDGRSLCVWNSGWTAIETCGRRQ